MKAKHTSKLVYWQEEIKYLYPFLLSVSEIIWRNSQKNMIYYCSDKQPNVWLAICSLDELTKVPYWKLATNLTGVGNPLRFLVFYVGRKIKIKEKAYPKNVCLPKKILFSSANCSCFWTCKILPIIVLPNKTIAGLQAVTLILIGKLPCKSVIHCKGVDKITYNLPTISDHVISRNVPTVYWNYSVEWKCGAA